MNDKQLLLSIMNALNKVNLHNTKNILHLRLQIRSIIQNKYKICQFIRTHPTCSNDNIKIVNDILTKINLLLMQIKLG